MAGSKQVIPKFVTWSQAAILSAITNLAGTVSTLTNLTSNPVSSTKGLVTRNVRDHEIIEAIDRQTEVLERIAVQLSFLTEIDLQPGDG